MSRMTPVVQQRLHTPESEMSACHEGHEVRLLASGAARAGWDFWVVRGFLMACAGAVSYTLGPFGLRGIAAASRGLLIGLGVLLAELPLLRAALCAVLVGAVVAAGGVCCAL